MLAKEIVFYILVTFCVLEGMRIEQYKLLTSKCDLKDVNLMETSTSIVICGILCTLTPSCKGYAMRGEACGLLQTCPLCCSPPTGTGDGWNVYCYNGKVYNVLATVS